jgi:hypothetical protein
LIRQLLLEGKALTRLVDAPSLKENTDATDRRFQEAASQLLIFYFYFYIFSREPKSRSNTVRIVRE